MLQKKIYSGTTCLYLLSLVTCFKPPLLWGSVVQDIVRDAQYSASLDGRISVITSKGEREHGDSSPTGTQTDLANNIGARWMLKFPSGWGFGIAYYAIANTEAVGFYDKTKIDPARSILPDEGRRGNYWDNHGDIAIEYFFRPNNPAGLSARLNIGFGDVGFNQKIVYTQGESQESDEDEEDEEDAEDEEDTSHISHFTIREHVPSVEIGLSYGFLLTHNTVLEIGGYYRYVVSTLFSGLSSPSFSVGVTTVFGR